MLNKAAGAFTYMETILLIGGPYHGQITQEENPGSNIIAAALSPVVASWDALDPYSLNYQQIVYRYEGYWNSEYGKLRIYVLDGKKYIEALLPNYTVFSLLSIDKELVFVFDKNWHTDESICYVQEEAFKAVFKQSPDKLALFVKQAAIIKEGMVDPYPKKSSMTLETLNEMLKKMYLPQMAKQLEWTYESFEQEFVATSQEELAKFWWLNAGLRDAKRYNLCYGCAEELIGPGFGDVNDMIVPKGKGKRVRKLACGNCGKGKFNRLGQRIGDWEAVA